jgi:hypothetical protein
VADKKRRSGMNDESLEIYMSAPIAFCPQCKNEVSFLPTGNLRRCPLCGFQFELGGSGAAQGTSVSSAVSGLGILLRFILILAAILMVVVGVVFVGCVAAFKF